MTVFSTLRRPGRPAARLAVAVAVGAGATLLAAGPAQAAQPSYVRLAHLSPDTPDVDIYLTSFSRPNWKLVLTGVGYGSLSGYQRLDAALYTVSMRPAGSGAASPPVLSATVRAVGGAAYTVAALGPYADRGLTVLRDDLSLPARNQARVRVVQASAKAKTVTVQAMPGPTIAAGVGFAKSTGYQTVPAGRWTLRASAAGQPDLSVTMPVRLDAGDVYSVLVLDAPDGGLRLSARTDAASAPVMPTGGVETGAGGTAGQHGAAGQHGPAGQHGRAPWLPVGLGATGLVLLAGAGRHRRARLAPTEQPAR